MFYYILYCRSPEIIAVALHGKTVYTYYLRVLSKYLVCYKFFSDNVTVYGYVVNGIEDYDVDSCEKIVSFSTDEWCEIAKKDILPAIDRMCLFMNTLSDNAINLQFSGKSVKIYSNTDKSFENVHYISNNGDMNYDIAINAQILTSQISNIPEDIFKVFVNKNGFIKLESDKVTQIIGLIKK